MSLRARGEGGRLTALVRFAPLAALLLVLALVLASGVWRHLNLEEVRERRTELKAFVRVHPWLSVLAYVAVYALVVALSIPGALVMTLSGGLLFGTPEGGAAAVAGVSTGAIIMFLAARTALGGAVRRRLRRGTLLARMEAGLRRHAFLYLLSLRLMPAAPIWMVNLAASVVGAPLRTYALATVLGVAPSTFIYAALGAGLDGVLAAGGPVRPADLFTPALMAPLLALAGVATLPLLVALRQARR